VKGKYAIVAIFGDEWCCGGRTEGRSVKYAPLLREVKMAKGCKWLKCPTCGKRVFLSLGKDGYWFGQCPDCRAKIKDLTKKEAEKCVFARMKETW